MDDDRYSPTIDEIIIPFFVYQVDRKTGLRARRIYDVERDLRLYLELDADRGLTAENKQILGLERAFDPDGAFARCMRAEELFFALADFLEPAWLPDDHVQTGVQIRMVERLLHQMLQNKLIPLETAKAGINRIVTGITRAKSMQQAKAALQR